VILLLMTMVTMILLLLLLISIPRILMKIVLRSMPWLTQPKEIKRRGVTISRKGGYHLFISRDEVQHLMINYFTLNGPRFTIEALSGTQCIGVHLEDQYSAFTMSLARCSPSFSQSITLLKGAMAFWIDS
jgi:hypothetical protein